MRRLSGFGWLQLIIGILMAVLGIYTLINPAGLFTGLAAIYGILAVVEGIADIIFYIRAARYTGFGPVISLISGILSVMAGIAIVSYPVAGGWAIAIIFPIWIIGHCISRLAHADEIWMRAGRFSFWSSVIISIIGLILGVLMLIRPDSIFLSSGMIIGIYLIVSGIEGIIIALSHLDI